ncbi:hypothetical protein AXG93_2415s1600 [Marchantia polymorpha subsp. ruderalis]|uniref:Uncharacterized protein n=1 Tax=Marchantia polymorpha subsp. ruderalis TaxID=1480154 RepID=A0A176VUU7_MARPO|nr:hypothetical protein AXG93_2415s1600 [Marchantia polymorpha subsp. ruderalis]
MDLLTRGEEKRFPREREILTAESSEWTEDDDRLPSIPPQTTAQGPVQVDVMPRRERPERRLAKRRRVVSDEEGDLALEVGRTETEQTRSAGSEEIPQPKTSEELVKELTLSDEILEQVVAQVGGTVVDTADITLPSSPTEDVRPEEEKKTSEE